MTDAPATPSTSGHAEVIDIDRPSGRSTTTVRVDREATPFSDLTEHERGLLLVRILCELVAYGTEPVDHAVAS